MLLNCLKDTQSKPCNRRRFDLETNQKKNYIYIFEIYKSFNISYYVIMNSWMVGRIFTFVNENQFLLIDLTGVENHDSLFGYSIHFRDTENTLSLPWIRLPRIRLSSVLSCRCRQGFRDVGLLVARR